MREVTELSFSPAGREDRAGTRWTPVTSKPFPGLWDIDGFAEEKNHKVLIFGDTTNSLTAILNIFWETTDNE